MPSTTRSWTLKLTPPDAAATTLTGVPQHEMYGILRSLMAGEPAADAVPAHLAQDRQAA